MKTALTTHHSMTSHVPSQGTPLTMEQSADVSLRRADQIRRSRVWQTVWVIAVSAIVAACLGLGVVRCIVIVSDAVRHAASTPRSGIGVHHRSAHTSLLDCVQSAGSDEAVYRCALE